MSRTVAESVQRRALIHAIAPGGRADSRGYQAAGFVLGIALLVAAAKLEVPFWPVPMTMQTLAVMLVGAAYGRRLATTTILGYLAMGVAGLPVFAGAAAGPHYMTGPTAGYLLGFVAAAQLLGHAADRGLARRPAALVAALLLSILVIYGLGWAWLATLIGAARAFEAGVLPFLLGDLLKVALAASAILAAGRAVPRRRV